MPPSSFGRRHKHPDTTKILILREQKAGFLAPPPSRLRAICGAASIPKTGVEAAFFILGPPKFVAVRKLRSKIVALTHYSLVFLVSQLHFSRPCWCALFSSQF